MKLKLNNEADVYAATEIAGLQKTINSIVAILAGYATETCPEEDSSFSATIDKELLADSYRSNPSLLAAKVLVQLQRNGGEWESCSGHLISPTHIRVQMSKQPKLTHVRNTVRLSVKGTIKDWLRLNEPKYKKLKLPISVLPAWYVSHPEQLTYMIKQETGTPIKITKLTAHWLISRK